MFTSVMPIMASSAAIPDQVVTLTISPVWTVALFVASLALTCGLLWLLKNVEHDTRSGQADHVPLSLARPSMAGHRA
jgi:hypothetical protein